MSPLSAEIIQLISISKLISSSNDLLTTLYIILRGVIYSDGNDCLIVPASVSLQSISGDLVVLYLLGGISELKLKYYYIFSLLTLSREIIALGQFLATETPTFATLSFLSSIFILYSVQRVSAVISSLHLAQQNFLDEKQIVLTVNEISAFRMGIPRLESNWEGNGNNKAKDSVTMPYDKKYEVSYQRLNILDYKSYLEDGFYGRSYKALYFDKNRKTTVNLQKNKPNIRTSEFKSFLRQLKVMMSVDQHENIVKLFGACTNDISQGKLYIITEYFENGNLSNFLRANKELFCDQLILDDKNCHPESSLNSLHLVRWSYEIACAMKFLHDKHIRHGALCCKNVLLTSDRTAKLTDFNIAPYMFCDNSSVLEITETDTNNWPWRHFAVECFNSSSFDFANDIWSYGVTTWEIFSSAEVPYSDVLVPFGLFQRLVKGHRLDAPKHSTKEIYNLMNRCWLAEPSQRISFDFICNFMFKISMPKRRTIAVDF